jgi:hypothetical protein
MYYIIPCFPISQETFSTGKNTFPVYIGNPNEDKKYISRASGTLSDNKKLDSATGRNLQFDEKYVCIPCGEFWISRNSSVDRDVLRKKMRHFSSAERGNDD